MPMQNLNNIVPFNNPPITEAVFDVRVILPQETDLEILQSFQSVIKDRFPIKKDKRKIQSVFRFEPGMQPSVINPKDEVYGYMFYSSDQKKVVQSRMDGFTFNRLRPYSNWEDFSAEALSLLDHYKNIAKPTKIIRLSLRYINRIELPLPFTDFKEYVLTIPELSSDMGFGISKFFMQLFIPNPEIKAIATLTEMIEEENSKNGTLPFIFDIDVAKDVSIDPDSKSIAEIMNGLRAFKNKIFLDSLTDKAKSLFQ